MEGHCNIVFGVLLLKCACLRTGHLLLFGCQACHRHLNIDLLVHSSGGLSPAEGLKSDFRLPVQERITEVQTALNRANLPFGARKAHPMTLDTYEFMLDKKDYNVYWDVRKGLIPIVGGARETGELSAYEGMRRGTGML